ncbi:MAG: ornithine carbamoyltransferase [Eubacteriales bacterium]|nr:ornithine carbamoyltransferase [Eubacteriales bacterium]
MKHLLKLLDCSTDEIVNLLDLADQLKYEKKHNIPHRHLEGKSLGLIFQKVSTRTRVSFEVGMYQLGGRAMFLSNRDMQSHRGEPMEDTARTLSRYLDGIMLRTFAQERLERLADCSSVPVISGMTDFAHPCQVLADLMTIRERYAQLEGLKLCYIGDGDNMCNSLIVGGLKTGMEVAVACPKKYQPHSMVLDFADRQKSEGAKFLLTDNILEAAADADVVFTDAWVSMGKEEEAEERHMAFQGYQINHEVMKAAKAGAMVQHCLPAYRGEEITAEVFEEHADEIFEEAENRLHAQKAVLVALLGKQNI